MEELNFLFSKANSNELAVLRELLNARSEQLFDIYDAFRSNATHSWKSWIFNDKPTYRETVNAVAKNLDIRADFAELEVVENLIAQKIWKTTWEKMTEEEKTEFNRKLASENERWSVSGVAGLSGITGAMLLAQTSGFGIYLLASSALGAVTASLGVTLPFLAYTAMSSVIHFFIGPAGWIGIGLAAVHHLTGPNFKRLTSAVLMVCCIRARLSWEEEEQARLIQEDLRRKLEEEKRDLENEKYRLNTENLQLKEENLKLAEKDHQLREKKVASAFLRDRGIRGWHIVAVIAAVIFLLYLAFRSA